MIDESFSVARLRKAGKELGRDAMLFKLSTRVRGSGNVGEMSSLINQAFEIVTKVADNRYCSATFQGHAQNVTYIRQQTT
jgi:hypothetical protein